MVQECEQVDFTLVELGEDANSTFAFLLKLTTVALLFHWGEFAG